MALSEATLGAIITGASAVGSAGISGYASGKMNKRAEKFNREEAEKQHEERHQFQQKPDLHN